MLIAVGPNRNASLDRLFIRDSTHKASAGGGDWALGVLNVDDVVFSTEPNAGAADSADDGDDTVLNMTFVDFKKEMSKFGLHMEALCISAC